MVMRTGKLGSSVLKRSVLRYRGKHDPTVILGPSIGEDAALVRFGDKVLVLKTDPITGTSSDIGFFSVHINANDIACRGATPRWFLCDILLPKKSNTQLIQSIMKDLDRTTKQLGVAIVGGHTEITPGLRQPILVGCMIGVVNHGRYVTSHGALPNHDLIMTKSAGIEGTSVLAMDLSSKLKIGAKLIASAKAMRRSISIVREAKIATEIGVSAMHDPTEGGLLQGIWEIAEASKLGFAVYEARIPIRKETIRICNSLDIDPLRLMSSGCLLIAANKRKSVMIVHRLREQGIQAEIIGTFFNRKKGRKLIRSDGSQMEVGANERDELYRVIETYEKH